MKNLLLIQLPVPLLNQEERREDDPLAPAYLKTYSDKNQKQIHIELLPETLRLYGSDQTIVQYITEHRPDYLGFSCYCWNIDRTLDMAKKIKELFPSITILGGGPEIEEDRADLFYKSGFNVLFEGEAESSLCEYLANPENSHRRYIHCLPVQNLDTIPNPYLEGILDPNKDHCMTFETVRGCPFGCIFCNYGKGSRKVRAYSLERIKKILDYAVQNSIRKIYLMDPSFNTHPKLEELFSLFEQYDHAFEIHTEIKADLVTETFAKRAAAIGIKSAEIGLQTVGQRSRKIMKQPFREERFLRGAKALQNAGIELLTDMIIGLPGDTPEDIQNTARFIKENELDEKVQVFHLSALPGTLVRKDSDRYQLNYMEQSPYYLTGNETLQKKDLINLMEWAEEYFDITFDGEKPPWFFPGKPGYPTSKYHQHDYLHHIHTDENKLSDTLNTLKNTPSTNHITLEIILQEASWTPQLQHWVKELLEQFQHTQFQAIFQIKQLKDATQLKGFIIALQSSIIQYAAQNNYLNNYYAYSYPDITMSFLPYLLLPAQSDLYSEYETLSQDLPIIVKIDNEPVPENLPVCLEKGYSADLPEDFSELVFSRSYKEQQAYLNLLKERGDERFEEYGIMNS